MFTGIQSELGNMSKHLKKKTFCGFPWVETSTAGRVYDLCVYYMTGAPEGSPKVVLCGFMFFFYGEAGNRTCDPWFTRHSAYPLHHGVNIYRRLYPPNMSIKTLLYKQLQESFIYVAYIMLFLSLFASQYMYIIS